LVAQLASLHLQFLINYFILPRDPDDVVSLNTAKEQEKQDNGPTALQLFLECLIIFLSSSLQQPTSITF